MKKRIGIVFADEMEYKPFVEAAEKFDAKKRTLNGCNSVSFEIENLFVTAIESGIGKVNAAFAASTLILEEKAEVILNAGLSGAISKVRRGDIVAGESFTECDFDYIHNEFYKFINGNRDIKKLYNHKNRYNNERDIEIYRRLPQGANSLHESIADIMPYKRRNDIFKDKYFKLDETQICKTITSHMRFDCNMYIHPWDARGLSPREAARIQTFPDDYVITGSQNMWYAQVGNAVPVKLAKAIGEGIIKFLR